MGRIDSVIAIVAGSTLLGFVGLVLFGLLSAIGLASGGTATAGGASVYGSGGAAGSTPAAEADTYEIRRGTLAGIEIGYLDFGTQSPAADQGRVATAPIWVFISGFEVDGSPRLIANHPSILDVMPGDAGYSDLWDVQLVVVPSGFDSRAIRSLGQLEASGLEAVPADLLVNCPIVPIGSVTAAGHAAHLGWYRGEQVQYFDLGVSDVQLGDVYEFVTSSGSSDAYGYGDAVSASIEVDPLFVPSASDAATHFFRLHRVEVPDAATAQAIRSVVDMEVLGLVPVSTGEVTNRPVVAH